MYLLQATFFLFIVSQVQMEQEMEAVSRALKTIDDNNPSRTFGNPADLMNFIINALDVTFMTKCSAYEKYIQGNFSK